MSQIPLKTPQLDNFSKDHIITPHGFDTDHRTQVTTLTIRHHHPPQSAQENKSTIEKDFGDEHEFKKGTISDFKDDITADVLVLQKQKFVDLLALPKFINLTILRLGNNFLTNIDSISECENLVWLDLHNNQLTRLPPARIFWKRMKNLMILNVHDNLFENFRAVQSVSGIVNLVALTVYNTPLTVTTTPKSYRHQLVNSCMNLKALDYHVISDEEIIEHFVIPAELPRFKTKSKSLKINLCPTPQPGLLGDDIAIHAFGQIQEILTEIDIKIKHCSPVQIIQRYTRGFLARKRNGFWKPKPKNKVLTRSQPLDTGRVPGTPTPRQDLTWNPEKQAEFMDEFVSYMTFESEKEKEERRKSDRARMSRKQGTEVGIRPPTSSRIHSARTLDPDKEKIKQLWNILKKDDQAPVVLNSLRKPAEKKYQSFPLKSEHETREWIDSENEKFVEYKPYRLNITGVQVDPEQFDSHAEKLDLLHLAKIHRSQMEELDLFKREEEEEYVKTRAVLCKQQREVEIQHNKQKIFQSTQNEAMLEAIRPLLKLAKERVRVEKGQRMVEKREDVAKARHAAKVAINHNKTYANFKQQHSRHNENFEQELIELALSDNKRRERLHREFAAKRAQIWRMKANSTKSTVVIGKQFAAEMAALNRNIKKHNQEYNQQQCLKQRQEFVKQLREQEGEARQNRAAVEIVRPWSLGLGSETTMDTSYYDDEIAVGTVASRGVSR